MKITTQQIKQIISEELDKLLYEEDSNDVLRKAVEESITDNNIDAHYQKMKKFVIKATQDLNIQQQMQRADQMLQSNDNEQITQVYDLFLGTINDLIKPNDNDTKEQREAKEKVLKQIEPFEQFLNAEDQKSFLANVRIEAKDLSGVDLWRADLSNANLRGADLSGADLWRADLQGADLREADLSGARLIGARYNENTQWPEGFYYINSGAIGPKANLIGTNLSEENLKGANLSKANLSYSDLSGANLSGADLSGADLWRADLREALYNDNTRWPNGFDPITAGAKKV
jgi:uncharacterized protein YjbI with pentapeptide repeats